MLPRTTYFGKNLNFERRKNHPGSRKSTQVTIFRIAANFINQSYK